MARGISLPRQAALLTTAVLVSLPLYRPLILDVGGITWLYALFAFGSLGYLVAGYRSYAYKFLLNDYLIHIFVAVFVVFASVRTLDFPVTKMLAMGVLYISYMLGRWVGLSGYLRRVMLMVGLIYMPVSIYVLYQLYINGFSYNRYIDWSGAALKLSYLDYAMYAGVLFLFVQESRLTNKVKVPLCLYFFITVLVSGARYSILFLSAVVLWKLLRPMFSRASVRERRFSRAFALGLGGGGLLLLAGVTSFELFDFSFNRMQSLLGEDASIKGRLRTLGVAFDAIVQRPMFGFGMDQSSDALGINYPHNIVLEVMLEGGVLPGLLMALIALTTAVYSVREIRFGDVALGLATLYVVGAFFKSFSFYEARITFFLIGVLSGAIAFRVALATARARSSSRSVSVPGGTPATLAGPGS